MAKPSLRRLSYWLADNWLKAAAIVLILVLAFADFLAMKNLFADLGVHDSTKIGTVNSTIFSEQNIYSLTLVLLLEGNPFFIGIAASAWADKTKYKNNDRLNAELGFIIAVVAFILTICLVMSMRILLIESQGGLSIINPNTISDSDKNTADGAEHVTEDVGEGTNDKDGDLYAEIAAEEAAMKADAASKSAIKQIGLMVMPLLTSLLAFVASWIAFRSESISKLEYRIDKLHEKFLVAQSKFLDAIHKNDDARTALWGSLTANDAMPSDLDTFRKECSDRIRAKLISNSITEFPSQVERYNVEILSLLREFVGEMGRHTTPIPEDIRNLDVDQIAAHYDEQQNEHPADAWSYNICGDHLEKELKTVLNNAVVVAQFKTRVKPFYIEGDK